MKDEKRDAPRGMRAHIGLFGRCNAGKSSLLNAICGQDAAIVSDKAGTTTDVVEKTLEYAPLGPVVFLDTAGLDDAGSLGESRSEAARRAMRRVDAALLVTDGDIFGEPEEAILRELRSIGVPVAILRNKADAMAHAPLPGCLAPEVRVLDVSARNGQGLDALPGLLRDLLPGLACAQPPLLRDLAPAGGLVLLVAPIDSGAPRGRLIQPQTLAIRDCLDGGLVCMICRDGEYPDALARLKAAPDLVVCDSQVVDSVVRQTAPGQMLTTFSILLARQKGDLARLARGAATLSALRPGDAVLIQEACSHHAQEDDIATVKLPRLLRSMAGGELDIRHAHGKDFSAYDPGLRLAVHCGGCVITRRQMLSRLKAAAESQVPMTNYGLAISAAKGVLERALGPFPEAMAAYRDALAAQGASASP